MVVTRIGDVAISPTLPFEAAMEALRVSLGAGEVRAAHFEAALPTVRDKAKESLGVKARPNVHTRLVWISAEDAEGWRGEAFAINITLSTASTVLTDRTTTRHGR